MTQTLPVSLILTAVFALVVTACGPAADDTTVPGEPPTTDAAATTGGEVVLENISFQPDELTVSVGTAVTWTNQDGISHTTTSDDAVWDSGVLAGGGTFSFTFDEPGTFEYFCSIHPAQMRATITVEG